MLSRAADVRFNVLSQFYWSDELDHFKGLILTGSHRERVTASVVVAVFLSAIKSLTPPL